MPRVLIIDDHAIVREGYRRLLERHENIKIVGEAGEADESYALFLQTEPDVVLLDMNLGRSSGLHLMERMLKRIPTTQVLVFSMHQEPLCAIQALRAGARGYVTKSSAPSLLVEGVFQVARGQRVLSPDIAAEVAAALLDDRLAGLDLSTREFEVMRLLMEGHEVEHIAKSLHLSPKTVRNLHYQLKNKLGVRSDIDLTKKVLQMNLVPNFFGKPTQG